jgi:hypothetical protein
MRSRWAEWAAQAATRWQPRLWAAIQQGGGGRPARFPQAGHPVATARPDPVVPASRERSRDPASQRLPVAWAGVEPARQQQESVGVGVITLAYPRQFSGHCAREGSMAHTVFVDGQEGTTGLRIHEYLAGRSDVEVLRIDPEQAQGRRRAGTAAERRRRGLPVPARCRGARSSGPGEQPRTCLIDASTAHRTHADWVFGLPELATGQRDKLRASKRIANPGCHATAFILLLRPWSTPAWCPRAAGQRHLDHRLLGRRQEDDRAISSVPLEPALTSPRPYGLTWPTSTCRR